MKALKYTVIKSKKQYFDYCEILEALFIEDEDKYRDEIELIHALIDKWDAEQDTLSQDIDPIELLKSFMEDHKLKAKDLAKILGLTKGTVSKMLNYRKGLSKQSIRILADHFKVRQDAFNRPYPLFRENPIPQKEAS